MKPFLVVVVLFLAGVACLGFYRGWFTASSGDTAHGVNVSIGVDQDKIRADEAAIKEKVHLGGKAKESSEGRTAPAKP
ncbi:MAG TPA: hypothetical protein VH120_13770 [Gemmataceae bacterium]|jgi:hypothetical protein|nr:hypothetical protein [Gemmataceae bacterium]